MRSLLFSLFLSAFVTTTLTAQNGLSFDGTNDFVQTPYNGITGNGARTIEAWIKPQFLSTQQVIADWGAMSPNGSRFTFNMIGAKLRCEIGGEGMTGSTVLSDGQWHHVAVVYDPNASSNFTLYVDGNVELAYNLSIPVNTLSTVNFRIGRRNDNVNHFIGEMDEVRVWDYPRTQAQIQANMNSEFCSLQSGLVAYHKFNEGTAGGNNSGINSSYDASGNGNNGTLNGFALSGSSSNWVTGVALTTSSSSATTAAVGCGSSYTSPSGNYTWTQSGTYQDTILSVAGCDSILTINLTFNQNTIATISESSCDSVVSPSGFKVWESSGTYLDTIPNSVGCDSIITVNVSIDTSFAIVNVVSCGTYTSPSGNYNWSISGFYYDTITNSAGCDSIMGIHLDIEGATFNTISPKSCGIYTSPSGAYMWNQSGTYTDTLANQSGCDSILTINLSVTNIDTGLNVVSSGTALSSAMTGASYQWIDCKNNSPIPGETNQNFILPNSSGSFAVVVSQNNCSDTTRCYDHTVAGMNSIEDDKVRIWPNPNDGQFTIQSDEYPAILNIWSLDGRLVHSESISASYQDYSLELDAGVYILELKSDKNTRSIPFSIR